MNEMEQYAARQSTAYGTCAVSVTHGLNLQSDAQSYTLARGAVIEVRNLMQRSDQLDPC